MNLKMKTCFKFLPLFFCFFFILSAPSCFSCGGSKDATKQLQQLEKKGENKDKDGNHDGGGSDGTTSTTTVTGDGGGNLPPKSFTVNVEKAFTMAPKQTPAEFCAGNRQLELEYTNDEGEIRQVILEVVNANQDGSYNNVAYKDITTGWVLIAELVDLNGHRHELWAVAFYKGANKVCILLAVDLPKGGDPGFPIKNPSDKTKCVVKSNNRWMFSHIDVFEKKSSESTFSEAHKSSCILEGPVTGAYGIFRVESKFYL